MQSPRKFGEISVAGNAVDLFRAWIYNRKFHCKVKFLSMLLFSQNLFFREATTEEKVRALGLAERDFRLIRRANRSRSIFVKISMVPRGTP